MRELELLQHGAVAAADMPALCAEEDREDASSGTAQVDKPAEAFTAYSRFGVQASA